jgi:hypothetical protein
MMFRSYQRAFNTRPRSVAVLLEKFQQTKHSLQSDDRYSIPDSSREFRLRDLIRNFLEVYSATYPLFSADSYEGIKAAA